LNGPEQLVRFNKEVMSQEDRGKSFYHASSADLYQYLDEPGTSPSGYFTDNGYKSLYSDEDKDSGVNIENTAGGKSSQSKELNLIFDEILNHEIDPFEAQMHVARKSCFIRRHENPNSVVIGGFDSQQSINLRSDYERRIETSQLWIYLFTTEQPCFPLVSQNILKFRIFEFRKNHEEIFLHLQTPEDVDAIILKYDDIKATRISIGFVSSDRFINFRQTITHMCDLVKQRTENFSSLNSYELQEVFKHSLHSIASSKQTSIAEQYTDAYKKLDLFDQDTYLPMNMVFDNFCALLRVYGRVIITEYSLDQTEKTIKSVDVGGVAGGEKFLIKYVYRKYEMK
jgi:hypothetical protein